MLVRRPFFSSTATNAVAVAFASLCLLLACCCSGVHAAIGPPDMSDASEPTFATAAASARRATSEHFSTPDADVLPWRPLRVAVMSIPFYGHYLPVKAVAEQLVLKGHHVTVFTENPSWCSSALESLSAATTSGGDNLLRLGCYLVNKSNLWTPALFERVSAATDVGGSMQEMFELMVRYQQEQLPSLIRAFRDAHNNIVATTGGAAADNIHEGGVGGGGLGWLTRDGSLEHQPFDVILYDMGSFVASDIAALMNLPRVAVNPMTLNLAVGSRTSWLGPMGFGYPRFLSLAQHVISFLIKLITIPVLGSAIMPQINANRVANGIPPYGDYLNVAGFHNLVLTPTVWGLDIPQPLCPNIRPLGVMSPLVDESKTQLEVDLQRLLDSLHCVEHGAVYINFGTLSVLTDATFARVARTVLLGPNDEALADPSFASFCVVMKITKAAHQEIWDKLFLHTPDVHENHKHRFYVTRFFASPPAIMGHPSVRVFVTHCGDTSVGEAIDAELPLAGIPIFADQEDVCQRLQESGAGVFVGQKHTFEPSALWAAVSTLVGATSRAPFVRNIQKLRNMSNWLGGPRRGAEHVEEVVFQNLTDLYTCEYLKPSRNPSVWITLMEGDSLLFDAVFVTLGLLVLRWILRRLTWRLVALVSSSGKKGIGGGSVKKSKAD